MVFILVFVLPLVLVKRISVSCMQDFVGLIGVDEVKVKKTWQIFGIKGVKGQYCLCLMYSIIVFYNLRCFAAILVL